MRSHSTEKFCLLLKHSIFQHTLKLTYTLQEVKSIIINLTHKVAKKLYLIHDLQKNKTRNYKPLDFSVYLQVKNTRDTRF